MAIIASLALTTGAWYIASLQVEEKAQIQFDYQSNQIIALLKERMSKYEDALWSGVAAIYAQHDEMNYEQWRQFSEALSIGQKYPGINGIGVIKYLAEDDLADFLAEQTADRPDFHIHPPHERMEFWPITFIEPIELNKEALGLDMAHENNRLNAAKKARDSGDSQVTGPIVLVQDNEQTPGFLLFAPFYTQPFKEMTVADRRQNFVGMVYAPFVVSKLMEGTLQNKNRLINISIKDGNQFLYDELHNNSEDFDSSPLFSKLESVDMYGREWTFELQSSKLFREQHSSKLPSLILICGLVIDSLLLGLFLILANFNKIAVNHANKISKKLVVSQAVLDTAVKSSAAGFAIIDKEANFIEVNDALSEWLGFTREELMKINSMDLIAENNKEAAEESLKKMLSGEVKYVRMERQYRHKDGGLLWGLVSSAIVMNDEENITNIVFHVIDIQREKKLLDDLVEQNKELEISNGDLEQFAYIASHDLKSPLNAIMQLASWIEEDCQEILPETSLEHLKLLMARSSRMSKLLEDLLSYAKVGRYSYKDERVDLKTLADDQCSLITMLDKIKINAPDAKLLIPRIPFETVIRNLISNAVKHHDDPEQCQIDISHVVDNENNIITIRDNGPGIPQTMHDRVFDMFQTLKPRDQVEGSGMGLAMVKRIVSRYKGEVKISSDGVRGTEVIIVWPMNNSLTSPESVAEVPQEIALGG